MSSQKGCEEKVLTDEEIVLEQEKQRKWLNKVCDVFFSLRDVSHHYKYDVMIGEIDAYQGMRLSLRLKLTPQQQLELLREEIETVRIIIRKTAVQVGFYDPLREKGEMLPHYGGGRNLPTCTLPGI